MNEKRFDLLLPHTIVNDTVKRKSYYLEEKEDVEEVVALLNDQTETITRLEEEIGARENDIKRLKRQVKTFKEDRDSNFKSAQYFREQLMKIPESIRSVWIE